MRVKDLMYVWTFKNTLLRYPNYPDKYIYNIYIIFTEYIKYTTPTVYSINKYKWQSHVTLKQAAAVTTVRQQWALTMSPQLLFTAGHLWTQCPRTAVQRWPLTSDPLVTAVRAWIRRDEFPGYIQALSSTSKVVLKLFQWELTLTFWRSGGQEVGPPTLP